MAHSMHWAAVGALLLAALGFAALGRWQLERAEVNRETAALFEDAAALPPLEQPVSEAETFRYRPMRLRGHYVPESQVLLDNMTSHGVAGYQVLTPFRVEGEVRSDGAASADSTSPGDEAGFVLVNRGWVPASPDRSQLPDIALASANARAGTIARGGTIADDTTGTGEVVVSGRVDRLPRAALDLGAPAATRGEPITVLSFPDFAAIESALGAEVRHFQLLLDPAAPEGFVREWAPETSRADRNIAYAVQWFGLALLALVIGIGMALKGRRATETVL